MLVSKSYSYIVAELVDENGQVAVTVKTAAHPDGYTFNAPNDPVGIAKSVIDVLAAQGEPA